MSGWPWPSSDATDKVIPAFVAALQSVQDVARNKRADIETKTGARVRYGYADLDAVLDAVKPELTAKGLAFTQAPAGDGVHAVLMHSCGQWLAFPALQVSTTQQTPQAHGSALTYARRYQMTALLNIAIEDDDGKAASKPPRGAAADSPAQNRVARDTNTTPATTRTQPARPHTPATAKPDAQTRMMHALFNGAGIRDHDDRVAYCADVLGHPVTSTNDLTKQERSDVIDALKRAEAQP